MYNKQFKTGDFLEFKLTSSSLLINIVRVSKEGPVISITGCENFITENEVKIQKGHDTYYVIKLDNPLKIRFTSSSCEDNENIEPDQVEEIILSLIQYNVDEQNIQLKYCRNFL